MPATSMMSMMAGGDYKTIIITTDENKDSIVNITVYASLTWSANNLEINERLETYQLEHLVMGLVNIATIITNKF